MKEKYFAKALLLDSVLSGKVFVGFLFSVLGFLL